MKTRQWKTRAILIAMVAIWTACGGGSNTAPETSTNLANSQGRFIIYGKVLDASTRAGVPNATVTLYIGNSDPRTETTKSNLSETAEIDETGDFSFTGVPKGLHRLTVSLDTYTTYEERIQLGDDGSDPIVYFPVSNGLGEIYLQKTCSANVYVYSDGTPIANVPIYTNGFGSSEYSATTDSSGLATFSELGQLTLYSFTIPAFDSDNNGIYDYQTTSRINFNCSNDDNTVAIELNRARRDDTIAIVGGSYEGSESGAGTLFVDPVSPLSSIRGINPSGSLVLVFNYPVSIADDFTGFSYTNTYVLSTDSNYNKGSFTGADTVLSAGDTVLTITPASPLTPNIVYNLVGDASATINGEVSYADFSNIGFDYSSSDFSRWYAIKTSAWTINDISADNYNGSNDGSRPGNTVYLEFPEYVYGRAIIESYSMGSTSYSAGWEINLGPSFSTPRYIVIDEDKDNARANSICSSVPTPGAARPCGCPTHDSSAILCNQSTTAAGEIKYVVPIFVSLADWLAETPQTVTIAIDATDYDGNNYTGTVTLPIQ